MPHRGLFSALGQVRCSTYGARPEARENVLSGAKQENRRKVAGINLCELQSNVRHPKQRGKTGGQGGLLCSSSRFNVRRLRAELRGTFEAVVSAVSISPGAIGDHESSRSPIKPATLPLPCTFRREIENLRRSLVGKAKRFGAGIGKTSGKQISACGSRGASSSAISRS